MGKTSNRGTVGELREYVQRENANKPIAFQIWDEDDLKEEAEYLKEEGYPEGIRFSPKEVASILGAINFFTAEAWEQVSSLITDVVEARRKRRVARARRP